MGMKHSVEYHFAYRRVYEVYESEKGTVWREITVF